jgi:hypothetical protein
MVGNLVHGTRTAGIQVTCVEPGFFRTEFLGGSSAEYVDAKLPEYVSGVKQLREWLDGKHQTQEGDPEKLAAVLLQLAAADKRPWHLLMGERRCAENAGPYCSRYDRNATVEVCISIDRLLDHRPRPHTLRRMKGVAAMGSKFPIPHSESAS